MSSTPISITLPQELLEQIKTEVDKGSYASVSEFVRDAVRDRFEEKDARFNTSSPGGFPDSSAGSTQSNKSADRPVASWAQAKPKGKTAPGSCQTISQSGTPFQISTKSADSPPPVVIFNIGENSWITGKVERGQQLGGKLGFPTLNLDPSLLSSEVPHGVFVAEVEVADRIYQAAGHYGPRKTLDEWRPTLEFHLLDFDQHIPGHLVRFRLLRQIRETMKFEGLDQLKKQLADDVTAVRRFFGEKE